MRILLSVFSFVTILAGCAAPVRDVLIEQPEDHAAQSVGRERAREIVERFVHVVDRVGPVAEDVCIAAQTTMRCDFLIAVDDRPEAPPNAFQTEAKNGRPVIAFTLALLADVQNEDELAFVMSHEAAHHIAGHLYRQQQNATIGAVVLGQIAGVLTAGSAERIRSAQEIGAAVGARSYSKRYELEADALGARITMAAGFDPVRGSLFFTRIPDPGDRFLGTHPANSERMAVVRAVASGS